MKTAVLASLIASAAAFAPAAKQASTSVSLNAFEDELGVQPPLGFFDPLGLLNGKRILFVPIQLENFVSTTTFLTLFTRLVWINNRSR